MSVSWLLLSPSSCFLLFLSLRSSNALLVFPSLPYSSFAEWESVALSGGDGGGARGGSGGGARGGGGGDNDEGNESASQRLILLSR